jgi:hypothetical protein
VEASLEAIRPNQEYKDFTEKHKYAVNYEYSFSYLRAVLYEQKIYIICRHYGVILYCTEMTKQQTLKGL